MGTTLRSRLLLSCLREALDATPAEGFDNDVIDDVLELREQGLRSVPSMYVGYATFWVILGSIA